MAEEHGPNEREPAMEHATAFPYEPYVDVSRRGVLDSILHVFLRICAILF